MWGSADPSRAPSQAQRAMAGVSVEVVRRRVTQILAVDECAALRSVAIPTLVLRATRDRVIPKAATIQILREAPHAQRVDIDGPHLLLATRPAECAAIIELFMRGLGAYFCAAFHFSTAAIVFSTCLSGFNAVYS
jgi:pimeloyl-ACP methyl ester carboxylesterase